MELASTLFFCAGDFARCRSLCTERLTEAFLVSTDIVALAEVSDKTPVAVIALAAQFQSGALGVATLPDTGAPFGV